MSIPKVHWPPMNKFACKLHGYIVYFLYKCLPVRDFIIVSRPISDVLARTHVLSRSRTSDCTSGPSYENPPLLAFQPNSFFNVNATSTLFHVLLQPSHNNTFVPTIMQKLLHSTNAIKGLFLHVNSDNKLNARWQWLQDVGHFLLTKCLSR